MRLSVLVIEYHDNAFSEFIRKLIPYWPVSLEMSESTINLISCRLYKITCQNVLLINNETCYDYKKSLQYFTYE